MAIKNAYSKINIAQLFQKLQKTLVDHGARKMMFEYDDEGRTIALLFQIEYKGQMLPIQLPANIQKVQYVLESQGFYKADPYRVAWRNVNDWVEAQLALIETEQATLPQVFLPYIVDRGQTIFNRFESGQLLLGDKNDS